MVIHAPAVEAAPFTPRIVRILRGRRLRRTLLALTLRNFSRDLTNEDNLSDAKELIRVLSRIIEGKTLRQAFGAPGDWGYNTPIGKALAKF